jgi:hypothetical protein
LRYYLLIEIANIEVKIARIMFPVVVKMVYKNRDDLQVEKLTIKNNSDPQAPYLTLYTLSMFKQNLLLTEGDQRWR